MTNTITITRGDTYVIVEYENGHSIAKIAYFEGTRMDSLIDRQIHVPSEIRVWDDERGISVRK